MTSAVDRVVSGTSHDAERDSSRICSINKVVRVTIWKNRGSLSALFRMAVSMGNIIMGAVKKPILKFKNDYTRVL